MNSGNQSTWQASEERLDDRDGIWAIWHWNSLENSVWSMTAIIGGIAIFLTVLLLIDWLIRQPTVAAEPEKNPEHVSLAIQPDPIEEEVQRVPDPIEPNYEPVPESIPEEDEEEVSPFWPGGTVLTEEPEKKDDEEPFDPFSFTDVPTPEPEEEIVPEPDPMIEVFWPTENVKAPAPVEIPLPEPEVPEFEKWPILPEFAVEEVAPVEVFPIAEPTPQPSLSLGMTQTDWLPDFNLPPDGILNVSAKSKFERIARPLQPVWGDINWRKFAKRDFKAEDAAYAKSLEPVIKEVKSEVTATSTTIVQNLKPELSITVRNPRSDVPQGTIQTLQVTLENTGQIATGRFILGARLPNILSHRFGQEVEQSVASLAPGSSITLPLIVRADEAGIGKLEMFSNIDGDRLATSTTVISVAPATSTAKPVSQPAADPKPKETGKPKCACDLMP